MKEFDEVSLEYKNTGARRYITGFDGLRVLALLGVIFYHLMPYKVPGGYLGVPIFFAVSGYLITDIFIQEWDRTGKIKLGAF
ncbi:acetyltransferase, partial [Pediococcus acidilactici]|nr:acetyltransferase [Pediococcus acidilactici]